MCITEKKNNNIGFAALKSYFERLWETNDSNRKGEINARHAEVPTKQISRNVGCSISWFA